MAIATKYDGKGSPQRNDVLLPNQHYYDVFLDAMSKILHRLRWVGIVGGENLIWRIWGVILLCSLIVIDGQAIWKVIKALAGWASDTIGNRSVTARFAGAMFYCETIIALVLCWRLSVSWQSLSKYWTAVEMSTSLKHVPMDKGISQRMHRVVIAVLFCSIFEHIMNIIVTSDFECPPQMFLQKYVLKSHAFLFLDEDYQDWMTLPILFFSNIATLIWNLQDLLIILISMGLSSRYKRLNQCVAIVSNMSDSDKYWCKNIEAQKLYTWRKIREAYVRQSILVRMVDGHLGGLVLTSCFFNFYFICLQLFLGVTLGFSGVLLKQVYYIVSFSWLCIRTVSTILSAADIHTTSRMALPYLYQCGPQYFNIEIERLQKQLSQEHVALSGMGFFYLNKTIVFQMGAAIFTYSLVLIQYDNNEHNDTRTQ